MDGARGGWGGFVAVVVLALLVPPSSVLAARGQSLNLAAGFASWYDNNLLQYSDAQVAQFESGLFPNRFSIKSVDDVSFNPSLGLTWELDEGRGRRHILRLRSEGDFHSSNPTADKHSFSLAWREWFRGGHRFLLRGYYLPSYYLRQLKDVATGNYERAQFSLTIAEAAGSQLFASGMRLGASYQLERRVYAPNFPERTSNTSQIELALAHDRLPARGGLELLGGYRVSLADGRDYPGGASSPYPDVSYHGEWVSIGGHVEFSRSGGLRTGGDLTYRYERRNYDSNRPTDKSHFGRVDGNNVVDIGLRAQFRPHWTIRGFDHYDTNKATYGQAIVLTSDPGSYSQNLIGIEITWSGDIWTQARAARVEEE